MASGSHPGIPVPEGADNLPLFEQEDEGQMRIKNAGGSRTVSQNVKTGNFHGPIGHILDTCKRKGLRVSPQPLEIFGGAVGDRTPDLMTASPSPLFGEFASQGWISLYSCRLAKNVHRSGRVSQG